MFAASKIEGGANHVNVRNFFEIIENVFIYLFIYYVFVKSVIVFCQEEQDTGEKATFRISDTSEQSSFSRKKTEKLLLLPFSFYILKMNAAKITSVCIVFWAAEILHNHN